MIRKFYILWYKWTFKMCPALVFEKKIMVFKSCMQWFTFHIKNRTYLFIIFLFFIWERSEIWNWYNIIFMYRFHRRYKYYIAGNVTSIFSSTIVIVNAKWLQSILIIIPLYTIEIWTTGPRAKIFCSSHYINTCKNSWVV